MKSPWIGLVVCTMLFASFALVLSSPPAAAAVDVITLYGNSSTGWGFGSGNISTPGPNLVVAVGDAVHLRLFSQDGATHTWFIDFNNNLTADPGEPISGSISSSTVPTWFNFTVTSAHVGTFTYRCSIHPTTMKGSITINPAPAPPNIILYASYASGWGFGPANMSKPGPNLTVNQGAVIRIELVGTDGMNHTFLIDLDHNGATPDASDAQSPPFGGPGVPTEINWTFHVDIAGNYTYYCGIHGAVMQGKLTVRGSSTTAPAPPDYTLYAAVVIVVVIVAVAVAVVVRRRPKLPPQQPPQQP